MPKISKPNSRQNESTQFPDFSWQSSSISSFFSFSLQTLVVQGGRQDEESHARRSYLIRSWVGGKTGSLGDYVTLLELLQKGSPLQHKVQFVWINQEDDVEGTAMFSAWYEVLSVLHLMRCYHYHRPTYYCFPEFLQMAIFQRYWKSGKVINRLLIQENQGQLEDGFIVKK